MAKHMTTAQHNHTHKTLTALATTLTTALTHPLDDNIRVQLATELKTARSRLNQLHTTDPNTAHRWTKKATTRTEEIARAYPNPYDPARPDPAGEMRDSQHERLRTETAQLIIERQQQLTRAAKVTTGRLHAAILTEHHRTTIDLESLPMMNLRALKRCQRRHLRAQRAWTIHGADHLLAAT